MSRDIGEYIDGNNLYAFLKNNSLNKYDILGLHSNICCPQSAIDEYNSCMGNAAKVFSQCMDKAVEVRDISLDANQKEYERIKKTILEEANRRRNDCDFFHGNDYARESCKFLVSTLESSAQTFAFASYSAQRGVIWATYTAFETYCKRQQSRDITKCKEALDAACGRN